jgi:chromosome partitioning protein
LLTKVPPAPEPEGAQLRAILSKQEIPVFTADIPRLKSFEKAAAEGVPVYDVNDPRARRAWDAYESVGKEVMKAVEAYTKKGARHA